MTDVSALARLDAMAQAELCRRGEVSAAELWDACQARLAALEPLLRTAVHAYREATAGFDLVLTPSVACELPHLGELSPVLSRDVVMARTQRVLGYTPIHNIAGCPAMSVPLHWSEAGLPIGAQLAGAPGQDAILLGLAYELEQARPWHERWPPYSVVRAESWHGPQ